VNTSTTPVTQQITQRSASNLALAFVLLPPAKRAAMAALYAFCREVDDIADDEQRDPTERRSALEEWRAQVHAACDGTREPDLAVIRELKPSIDTYRLPRALFDALIDGVMMDLDVQRYADRESLERYCYHVASVVGLLSIEIFGYTDPACRRYADSLGKALQLTNILRDIGQDARRGRIYVPQDLMNRFGVAESDILEGRHSPRFESLCRELAGWARSHYAAARSALPEADRHSMVAAELMGAVYWALLRKLEHRRFEVLGPRLIRLSKARKLGLVLLAWAGMKTGLRRGHYGS
jgi:phytoene synthase